MSRLNPMILTINLSNEATGTTMKGGASASQILFNTSTARPDSSLLISALRTMNVFSARVIRVIHASCTEAQTARQLPQSRVSICLPSKKMNGLVLNGIDWSLDGSAWTLSFAFTIEYH